VAELKVAVVASEVVSVVCLAALWCGHDSPVAKLLWTALVVVPFFGPLAYAVWHDPPPPSDPTDRPPEVPWEKL